MLSFFRKQGPGPARKRAARTFDGRRAHSVAYWSVVSNAERLEHAEPGEYLVDLLGDLELAVIQSTGYSNPELYDLACRVLHEGQKLVLNNGESANLAEARQKYWNAAREGLE